MANEVSSGQAESLGEARLALRWRDVGLVCLVVAMGAVAALIVVVAVGKPDALSTTALVLAIVSFGVQFAAYAAASADASRQLQQSMAIYADTRTALASLQATAALTKETLLDQNVSLVQTLIDELRDSAEKVSQQATPNADPVVTAGQIEALERRLEEALANSRQARTPSPGPPSVPKRDRGNERAIRFLETWPEPAEFDDVNTTLTALSDTDLTLLAGSARIELLRRKEGHPDLVPVWFAEDDPEQAEAGRKLLDSGLARSVQPPTRFRGTATPDEHWIVLTPAGRKVGRIFTAEGEPPDPRFAELRGRVEREWHRRFADTDSDSDSDSDPEGK